MSNEAKANLPEWLADKALQSLLHMLEQEGEEARVNGGAVRNTLLGEPVADIDISTTLLPEQVMERAQVAEFRAIPTGLEHGTITIVIDRQPFEVTTLRSDVETDGRHAKVAFTQDWVADASRRDFTMNALYMNADGTVFDPLNGREDLEARRVRFIGDPEARIKEDYLRILRFFRFFAWYGKFRPEAEDLKACARLKSGMEQLSVERIWSELKKLLAAPDPSRALLWMRTTGVLPLVLPESEKWGIDAIPRVIAAGADLDWPVDPLLRLMAMMPPDAERMAALAKRLKLSNGERGRVIDWAMAELPPVDASEQGLAERCYRGSIQGLKDRVRLELARLREGALENTELLVEADARVKQLSFVEVFKRPTFPVTGKDLIANGVEPGAAMGKRLKELEEAWIESGFKLRKKALLENL